MSARSVRENVSVSYDENLPSKAERDKADRQILGEYWETTHLEHTPSNTEG